jgi:hypothetical protein
MATLFDAAALARHTVFRDRVRVAALRAAVNIASEAPSGDANRDGLRSTLATNVLADPDGYTDRFAWATITNATVADAGLAAPDGDIEFVVASVWDALAGV